MVRADPGLSGEAAGTLVQRARAGVIAVVARLVAAMPEGLAIRLAELAGRLWYRATPGRAALARRQLRRVCAYLAERGDASTRVRAAAAGDRALEALVRSAYRHAARYYLELMRTPRIDMRYIRDRVLIETPDLVDEAFRGDRPVIFVGAHFGSIELPALYLAQRSGRRVTGPMETIGDPALQRWFVRTRASVGVRIVDLREARRELMACLRRGEPVGLVGDRDITGGGLPVSLFGHPARVPIGPALLAAESGAPIYVAGVRRAGPGRYRARLERVEVPADGTRRERTAGTVQRIATAFEGLIADAPDQWWAVFFPIWDDLATDPDERGRSGEPTERDGPTAVEGQPDRPAPAAGDAEHAA